jgi:phosphate/sulfate permease
MWLRLFAFVCGVCLTVALIVGNIAAITAIDTPSQVSTLEAIALWCGLVIADCVCAGLIVGGAFREAFERSKSWYQ